MEIQIRSTSVDLKNTCMKNMETKSDRAGTPLLTRTPPVGWGCRRGGPGVKAKMNWKLMDANQLTSIS